MLTIMEVALALDATPSEVMDNGTITLGEAMHAAELAGLDPEMDYMGVPLIAEWFVYVIGLRIAEERAA